MCIKTLIHNNYIYYIIIILIGEHGLLITPVVIFITASFSTGVRPRQYQRMWLEGTSWTNGVSQIKIVYVIYWVVLPWCIFPVFVTKNKQLLLSVVNALPVIIFKTLFQGFVPEFLLGRGKNQSCELHCSWQGMGDILSREMFKI